MRPHSPFRMAGMAAAAFVAMVATAPAQTTPATAASKPLARYVPEEGLAALLEFDGLDAHAASWKKSATYKILNETKMGTMLESLFTQGVQAASKGAPPGLVPSPQECLEIVKYAFAKGFVFGLRRVPGKDATSPVLAVRGAAAKTAPPALGRLMAKLGPMNPKVETRGKRQLKFMTLAPDGPVLWNEGDDLIMTSKDFLDTVLAVIDGKGKNAANNATRMALRKTDNGLEPFAAGFVDMAMLPPLPPPALAMGLGGLKRVEVQMGVQDDALMTVLRAVAPAPRTGVLALLDGPTFTIKDLPPIPADVHGFTVMALDARGMYNKVTALMKEANPKGAAQIDAFEQGVQQGFGLRVREDVLAHLGPKVAIYAAPGDGFPLPIPPAAMPVPINAQIPRLSLLLQTDSPAAVNTLLDKLMPIVNMQLAGPNRAANAPSFAKVPGGYSLKLPPLPGPLAEVKPTIQVGKTYVAISLTAADAQKALKLESASAGRWTPSGAFATMSQRLPKNLVLLNVSDPRDTLPPLMDSLPAVLEGLDQMMGSARRAAARAANAPAPDGPTLKLDASQVPSSAELTKRLYPGSLALSVDANGWTLTSRESFPGVTSPAAAGVGVALLLPAVQAAREAARRAQCTNNEKQMMLAMHNYESSNNTLPPPAILSKDGKPLLSWRVAILPYLEQQALYNEFHLDEAWDSPHNKALIERMPKTFECPSKPGIPGMTTYRVFTGKGAAFDLPKGTRIAAVTDGTSSTIAIVEAKEGVPWTQPEGLPLPEDGAAALDLCGSNHPSGFNASMLDGSVRFLHRTIAPMVFRNLLTRSGGEVINGEAF